MKLFRYAASLLTLAMLGACSSEEPAPVNGGGTTDETGAMYLSINVKGPETTRATKPAEDDEKTIGRIQIIVKNGTKEWVNKTITSDKTLKKQDGTTVKQIDGSKVVFAVDNVTFDEMKKHANEETWEILVYVNGANTSYSGIMTGSTPNKTWGIENAEGDGYNTDGFTMSNAEACIGKLQAIGTDGTNDGKTVDEAWQIKANVTLSRLATRFDYVKTGENKYTLLSDNKVKLSIVGMGVNTFANKTFRIAQFSSDGKVPSGGIANATHFKNNDAGSLFRVTDSYDTTEDDVEMPDNYADQNLWLIPDTKETIYARPNTIYQGTPVSYIKVPYAVVKAKITVDGADENNSSFGKHEALFAMDGILIGGARDLKALKTASKQFAVTYNETGLDTDKKKEIDAAITKVVGKVNNYIATHQFKDLDTGTNLDDENAEIVKLLDAEQYDYDTKNKGYFTYYASYIQHSNTATDDAWKYGVSRNTVYQLGVASFGFLGNNGEGEIGDGPAISKIQDLYMNLTVTISDWELNILNKGWNL